MGLAHQVIEPLVAEPVGLLELLLGELLPLLPHAARVSADVATSVMSSNLRRPRWVAGTTVMVPSLLFCHFSYRTRARDSRDRRTAA
jgi:hypothetical protein